MIKHRSGFLQVMMRRLLVLPQLELSRRAGSAAPSRQIIVVALGYVRRRAEAWGSSEEGDDSHADAHTECSGGRGAGAVGRVRDDGVVVVVVVVVVVRGVEGGGRGDDEDVAEADHAHIRREAVVDGGAGGGGPGGGAARERGGIEAEGEVVGGGGGADSCGGGGGGGHPVSECAGVRKQPPGRRSHN